MNDTIRYDTMRCIDHFLSSLTFSSRPHAKLWSSNLFSTTRFPVLERHSRTHTHKRALDSRTNTPARARSNSKSAPFTFCLVGPGLGPVGRGMGGSFLSTDLSSSRGDIVSERHPRGAPGVTLEAAVLIETHHRWLRIQADVGYVVLEHQPPHQPLHHPSPDALALPRR